MQQFVKVSVCIYLYSLRILFSNLGNTNLGSCGKENHCNLQALLSSQCLLQKLIFETT